jgi:hypothetical protein
MTSSPEFASDADLVVPGGRNFYGVALGILMLDVRLPRIPGDVGNATTWPWPVLFRVIPGAGVKRAIRELRKGELLEPFLAGARELDAAGVSVITTSCGYCALFQRELQDAVSATVVSSALLQLGWLGSLLPSGGRIGILTMEAASLTPEHLAAAGAPAGLPTAIVGMEETSGYTHRLYLEGGEEMDVGRMRQDVVDGARLLVERHPDVAAIVFECTNFPPFAYAVAAATGRPVYDLTTAVGWALAGHLRRPFQGRL